MVLQDCSTGGHVKLCAGASTAAMTMTTVAAMPSSEASSSPSSKRSASSLRGPRPLPLKVSSSSRRGSSPPTMTTSSKPPSSTKKPVTIVYEHTPKVIHARPQEFMTVVQRLTGKPPAAPTTATAEEGGGDPLLLTLGQRQQTAPAATAATTTTMLPSPMAAGMLMSPGFIFSPNTMQAIQELSPLF